MWLVKSVRHKNDAQYMSHVLFPGLSTHLLLLLFVHVGESLGMRLSYSLGVCITIFFSLEEPPVQNKISDVCGFNENTNKPIRPTIPYHGTYRS